jgi:Secretion system C-terminal sorting domain
LVIQAIYIIFKLSTIEVKLILDTEFEDYAPVKVCPNPIKNILFIKLKMSINYFVSVLDLIGNKVFEQAFFNENILSLDLSTLKKGLYLVLINNNQEIYS